MEATLAFLTFNDPGLHAVILQELVESTNIGGHSQVIHSPHHGAYPHIELFGKGPDAG
ncbi:Hypothetical protein FKW44_016820 [Caligus rogercresseyi]|uniref:Uncharacterized protein n=1 Tax=Caligus rogercresseyi TaxID=217165 RepID=A0A7T8H2H6_CALRO|nr:Hypothetical protein FKW44_016820 [Caligus rogercresseyi]